MSKKGNLKDNRIRRYKLELNFRFCTLKIPQVKLSHEQMDLFGGRLKVTTLAHEV